MDEDDLSPAEVPQSWCPECGEEATEESVREHDLSAMGYLHDDVKLECSNGHRWTLGVPIGDPPEAEDMVCDSCGETMAVHRVIVKRANLQALIDRNGPARVGLHLKCPACNYFTTTQRRSDARGTVLIGNPETTGQVDGAETEGYPDDIGRPRE